MSTVDAARPPSRVRRRRPGRPATEKEFDSREALLAATHQLLLESGGGPVSLGVICARAGVNVAMVHYHFSSRRGLMTALFERLCAAWAPDMESLLALQIAPRRKLEIHVRQIIRNYRRYPYTTRLMTELITTSKAASARRMTRNFVQPLTHFYERLIGDGVKAGEFRPIDPEYFFFSVVGLCEFFFAAKPLLGAVFGIAAIDGDIEAAFGQHTASLLLHGVGPKTDG